MKSENVFHAHIPKASEFREIISKIFGLDAIQGVSNLQAAVLWIGNHDNLSWIEGRDVLLF